jgi:hypothetical protein
MKKEIRYYIKENTLYFTVNDGRKGNIPLLSLAENEALMTILKQLNLELKG